MASGEPQPHLELQLPEVWRKEDLADARGGWGTGRGAGPGTAWPLQGAPCLLGGHSRGDKDENRSSDDILSTYNVEVPPQALHQSYQRSLIPTRVSIVTLTLPQRYRLHQPANGRASTQTETLTS